MNARDVRSMSNIDELIEPFDHATSAKQLARDAAHAATRRVNKEEYQ